MDERKKKKIVLFTENTGTEFVSYPSLMERTHRRRGQRVYVCIKGIHRWCGCHIPRPIQTAMPNDVRHGHKQTGGRPGRNLFSIRPMRSKLIVPHFWYAVVISAAGLASLKHDPTRWKKNIHHYE